jgi:hypothetical protein
MSYFSCLLVGPPGCGKSTAASTAPSPVLYLDMDQKVMKMNNISEKVKSGKILVWTPEERLFSGKLSNFIQNATNPQAKYAQQRAMGYIKLGEVIDNLEQNKCIYNGTKVETVVLDTFTSTEEHLKRLLMSANGIATITQPLWGIVLTNYENLLSSLLSLKDVNIIVIAHQQAVKDDLTGAITYVPLIGGQMKDKIGKEFEEVYFMEKKIVGDKAVYEMLTLGSSMKECRTTRVLQSRVEPDFSKLYGGK